MHFSRILSSCCVILLLFTGYSCRNASETKQDGEKVNIKYAEGFDITRYPDYIKVDLRDPWDTTRLLHRYLLVDKKKDLPQSLPDGTLIRTPVDRMVVYSSVHGSMLDELGIAGRIVGVCESEYISVPSLRDGIDSGRITDVGNSFSPDVEKIIDLSPEVILVSPFENCSYGRVEKLDIPIIECADYMENTPLGRAEWIRFIGLFTGRESQADSLFATIERQYIKLCQRVSGIKNRPTVISEKKTGSTWFVPGGNSYMARLFADAGVDYFWKDDKHAGSLALSFESVFDKAQSADFWLFKYSAPTDITLRTLASEHSPYSRFIAFEKGRVFGCNLTRNRFFEEVPLHPDLLLKDFILIFHPELFPGERCRYYHHLQP